MKKIVFASMLVPVALSVLLLEDFKNMFPELLVMQEQFISEVKLSTTFNNLVPTENLANTQAIPHFQNRSVLGENITAKDEINSNTLTEQQFKIMVSTGELTGPTGGQSPEGLSPAFPTDEQDRVTGIVQNSNGNSTALIGGTPVISYYPARESNNYSGGSIFAASELSSNKFISSQVTINTSLTNNGATALNGATTIAGNLTMSGTAIFSGTTTVTGLNVTSLNPGFSIGSIVFQGSSGLTQDNANLFYDSSNIRLGIGTALPASLLHVAGAARLGVASTTAGTLILHNASNGFTTTIQASSTQSSNITFTLPPGVGSNGQALLTDGSGGLYFGTALTASGTAGHIQFFGSSSALNSSQLFSWDNSNLVLSLGTTSTSSSISLQGKEGVPGLLGITSSTGSSLFQITASGNVGIGTSTPTKKLTVDGSALLLGNSNPVAVSTTSVPNAPRYVYVAGKYAYTVSTSNAKFAIFDISNPENIVAKASSSVTSAQSVFVAGKYAYVVGANFYIFDISDPNSIVQKFVTGLTGTAISVYVSGKYAYITHSNNSTLLVYDVSNPSAPVLLSSVATDASPREVYVSGKYAYVISTTIAGLAIFDISNPYNMVAKSSTSTNLSAPNSVYVSGAYAYVTSANNDSLVIYDISNPNSIVLKSVTTTNLDGPFRVIVAGKYAYVINSVNNKLAVFDVSNPSAPVAKGFTSTNLGTPLGLAVAGKYAYVVNNSGNSLAVFELENMDSPSAFLGSAQTGLLQVNDNAIVNNNLYVQGGLNVGPTGALIDGEISVQGTGGSYFAGKVSIGTSATTSLLHIQGTSGSTTPLFTLASSTGTQQFTVTSAGNVGVGTTTPSQALVVVGNAQFTAVGSAAMANDLRITAEGILTTNTSDINLKTNLGELQGSAILNKVLRLKAYTYNWKADPEGAKDYGFVAQEVAEIFPEVTFTNQTDGIMGINYSRFAAILSSAIQGQQETINNLQLTVNALQGEPGGNLKGPVIVKEHLYLSKDSVGQGKILAGSTKVRVNFEKPYEFQPIVTVTPVGILKTFYAVDNIDNLGFDLIIDDSQNADTVFNWHAFAGQGAKLTVSDGSIYNIELVVKTANTSDESFSNTTASNNENEESSDLTEAVAEELTSDNGEIAGTSTPDFVPEETGFVETITEDPEPVSDTEAGETLPPTDVPTEQVENVIISE